MHLKSILSLALALVFSVFISFSVHFFTTVSFKNWPFIPAIFIAFFFIYNLVYMARSGKEDFTQFLLFSLAIKLLLAFFTLLLCAFLFRAQFNGFSIHFVTTYMVFTVFEIRFLNQLIQSRPKSSPSHPNV